MRTALTILFFALIFLIACAPQIDKISVPSVNLTIEEREQGINVTEDSVKYLIHPSKLLSGGPPKGGIGFDRGIPAINKPKFVPLKEVDWIKDNELVIALVYKNITRVYPLQILVWHEIVNDVVAGDPLLISYCPLCGSAIAYERTINGEVAEFGVSGKLYNSDLVMYDDLTDTYWSQIEGLAIVGPLTGMRLKAVSVDTVIWKDWKASNPDSDVLSQDTGFSRDYGRDPYGNYYFEDYLLFPVEHEDEKVRPKTVVFGIEVNGVYKAYKEDDLIGLGIIEDEVNDVKIKITRSKDGIVKILNVDANEEIIKERDFWFAWYAFHPDTLLYEKA